MTDEQVAVASDIAVEQVVVPTQEVIIDAPAVIPQDEQNVVLVEQTVEPVHVETVVQEVVPVVEEVKPEVVVAPVVEQVAPVEQIIQPVVVEQVVVAPVVEEKKVEVVAPVVQEEKIEIQEQKVVAPVEEVKVSHEPRVIVSGATFKTSSQRKTPPVNDQSTDIGECTRRQKGHEDALVERLTDDIQTAYHSFKNSVAKHGARPCMGYRPIVNGKAQPYKYSTYTEVYEHVLNLASGLRALGVQPNQHVGIFSKNRMEWQITSEACHTQSMVTIALYDTLGEESSLFIMNHGEIVCLLISAEVFPQVAKIAAQCQYLKNLVVFEELSDKIKEDCNKLGLAVRSFSEVEELGKSARVSDVVPTADTLATIMYTSGTTGMPKGVMLTHRNIIAAVSGVTLTLMTITDQDVLISYLPLAHILERAAELVFFQNGACIGFTQGIIKEMLDDVQALRPTFFPAVPRVLDRFYDKIQGNVATSSKLKKWMFNKAIEGQKHKLGNPHGSAGLCAKLVIPKMKKLLGGRVRGMLSGGAPLNPKVHEFLQCAFDCSIVQGYGLTETCAACTIQLHYDTGLAQIGPPLASCEVKLVSVPEMNYLTTNEEPSGEILIRGANVSSGYYKDEEKTREVFDTDGWFHTGDVGKFNKNGTLSVIDRVKNIFKLSQGEYVAVENLELRLLSPYLARIWIYGDSLKSQLIAVGVVNPEVVQQYAKENNIAGSNIDEIIANPAIKKMILADLDKKGKEVKLKGFEFVKNIYLVSKDFDTVDGTTPTMKLKRNVLKNVYQNQLNEMYAELEKETPSA